MFDGGMSISFYTINCPAVLLGHVNKNKRLCRRWPNPFAAVRSSSRPVQAADSGNLPKSGKISGLDAALWKSNSPKSLFNQANTVGIIGGAYVSSTLSFLQKLVRWSTRDAEECPPFVVCSDPALNEKLLFHASFHLLKTNTDPIQSNHSPVVQDLLRKRAFLEQSGAGCIAMPCHISHAWHSEVSEGCSIPFLHVGECVARELKEAKLKPLEAGSGVRIGVLANNATLSAGFYQEKLQSEGFEVVLPDKATMEHIIIPAIESLNQRDMKGAQNLLRIAVQVLLVRAVNFVIIASDDIRDVIPQDDPLVKKCIDPMDALARSTVKWAKSNRKAHHRN